MKIQDTITIRVIDNLLDVLKTLTPQEQTPFVEYISKVSMDAQNLRYYLADKILSERS